MTKHFGVFFGSAVHLQNANVKFHKVVKRRYSGEVENVYTFVRQIYSGQYMLIFIRIGADLWKT